ncbi:hypothetical protein H4219_006116, partial [Mycoemilia scoparia]
MPNYLITPNRTSTEIIQDISLEIEAQLLFVLDVWEHLDTPCQTTSAHIIGLAHNFHPFYNVMNSAKLSFQSIFSIITNDQRIGLYMEVDNKTMAFMSSTRVILIRLYNIFRQEYNTKITNEEEAARFKADLQIDPDNIYNDLIDYIDARRRYLTEDQNFGIYSTQGKFYEILDDIS